jgi:Phosphotransferase enzyme family
LGEYLGKLHRLPLPHLPGTADTMEPGWDGYARFLRDQRSHCHANHQEWGDLPQHLLDQIGAFVLPVEQLIDLAAPPHLIHADLTADHLLGRFVNGSWQTLAIIDWGDARTGNLLYDLAALHLDMFAGDKTLLKCFLENYGLPEFLRVNFPQKALSMVLMHQFPMPPRIYAPHQDVTSLQDLAERLFGVWTGEPQLPMSGSKLLPNKAIAPTPVLFKKFRLFIFSGTMNRSGRRM